MITFDDFLKIDIRVGTIIKAEVFKEAKKNSYKVWVDFGIDIGIKKTSAQITEFYNVDELKGKQVLGVVNFKEKQIANFISEFLLLGTYSKDGVILITTDKVVSNGDKLG